MESNPVSLVPPLIILSPGRSYSTIVSAMLGCHRSLYALPETCLLLFNEQLRSEAFLSSFLLNGGLIEAVRDLYFSASGEEGRRAAVGWILDRRDAPMLHIFDELRARVSPRVLVEKTPAMTANLDRLRSIDHSLLGTPRYLHLCRHPRSYGKSLLDFLKRLSSNANPALGMRHLRNPDSLYYGALDSEFGVVDPQFSWLRRHMLIGEFLDGIDKSRHLRLRGEDFLTYPRETATRVLDWLGLSHDRSDIEAVIHPEYWAFAHRDVGGCGDPGFFRDPKLRPLDTQDSLEGELSWRRDGSGFCDDVRRLASEYGYR